MNGSDSLEEKKEKIKRSKVEPNPSLFPDRH
jgi:hypothetical protein